MSNVSKREAARPGKAPLLSAFRRNAEFVRGVAALLGGQSGALLVTFLLTPVVARLFTPDHFGVMATLIAIIEPMVVFATLQLNMAFVLPAERAEARRLVIASLTWLVLFCLFLAALAFGLARLDAPLAASLAPWWWVLPVGVGTMGLTRIAAGWNTREKRFGTIATSQVARALTTTGTRIGLGAAFGSSAGGLVAGYLAGIVAELATMWRRLPPDLALPRPPARAADVTGPIVAYRDFPLLNVPTGFLRGFAQSLPPLALGVLYSTATVGFYAMAVRLIGTPGNVMAMAVRRAYMQRGAEVHNAGRSLRGPLLKTTLTLTAVGLPPTLLLALFGEHLIVLLLGAPWAETGVYAQILATLLFAQWVSAPAVATLVLLRRQQLTLYSQIFVVVGEVAVFVLVWTQSLPVLWAIAGVTAVRVVADLGVVAVAWRIAGRAPSPAPDAD